MGDHMEGRASIVFYKQDYRNHKKNNQTNDVNWIWYFLGLIAIIIIFI